ncbi:MAG: spondin domain-containing protein [Verrucomicrobiota bacterium]
MTAKITGLALLSIGLFSQANAAFDVRISVVNDAAVDGLYFTPLWTGFHSGNFDLFDPGSTASAGLEELAEEGMAVTLNTEFGTGSGRLSNSLASDSGIGPGLFDPGRSASFDITLDESANRYLSFASMLLPSNDAFFGNGNPTAYELFDAMGNFNGPFSITILGQNIWDAGSEVNDTLGAPFSMIPGDSTDENVGVSLHPGLDDFVGTALGNNDILGTAFTNLTPIATINISAVPEPSSFAAIAGVLALGWTAFGRRRFLS